MSVRDEEGRWGGKRIMCDRTWPDGRRFRRVMPNRALARQMDERIGAAIATGTWKELRKELERGTEPDSLIRDYADHYVEVYCKVRNRDWERKESSLKHVKRLLGSIHLADLEIADVHKFVAKRMKEEVKAATVNRDVTTLKHMFEFAVEEGLLKHSPIARIRKLKEFREERPRVTEGVLQAVLKHLPFPVKQIVLFIFETGCRPNEALALKRDHTDLEKQTAIFNIRKAGDNALVALTSRAIQAVREVPALPGCPYVFWNPKTQTRYRTINNTFERARNKAGASWLQIKDFRRELGIVIAESGEPLHVAQTQLGHSSVRTTEQYYAHFSPEFAVGRARTVLEERWRQSGGGETPETPSPESTETTARKVVDFQRFRRASGGGERIRTAE